MSIPLELRQKILLLALENENFLKDIAIAIDDLDYPEKLKIPKGSHVNRWVSSISNISYQIADEMRFVEQEALTMLEKEEIRVVALVEEWREIARARDSVSSYLWCASIVFHTGLPDSVMGLEKQRLDCLEFDDIDLGGKFTFPEGGNIC